jgi:hypothetical protein
LFEVGDTVNPEILAESGKLLRSLNYMQDATIQLYNSTLDSIDVIVVTKDVFPWVVAPVIITATRGRISIRDINVAGLGHSLNNSFAYDASSGHPVNWNFFSYYIDNLFGSFINGTIKYDAYENQKDYALIFDRSLIPYRINWGGGLELLLKDKKIEYLAKDSTIVPYNLKYFQQDVWTARQFPLTGIRKGTHSTTWLVPGIRVINRIYQNRAGLTDSAYFSFGNYTDLLFSVALYKQEYFRVNYLNQFGKTEDFPYGFQVKITGGYNLDEFIERSYTGISLAYGGVTRKHGLYFLSAEYGGFLYALRPNQSVLYTLARYAFPLLPVKRCFLRSYVSSSYTLGIERKIGDRLYLNDDQGITGLNTENLTGVQRLYFNFKSTLFTPVKFAGFRLAILAAADFGFIGDNRGIFANQMFSSYSLGIGIKNDYLIFGTFHFRFTFLPKVPSGADNSMFVIFEIPDPEFNEFVSNAPSHISFE